MAWTLIKLILIFDFFPSHFNNIFPKSFGLLQKLTRIVRFYKGFMKFDWYNTLLLFAMYFVDFQYFRKLTAKFQFHLNRFEISKCWTWRWQKLKKSYRSYLLYSAFSQTFEQQTFFFCNAFKSCNFSLVEVAGILESSWKYWQCH